MPEPSPVPTGPTRDPAPEPLPDGTLTLLFSDIEGSTVLLDRLGLAYRDVLSRHREIVRAAVAAGHGREMGTEGDSFFVVFRTAEDAVTAAARVQRELAATRWPEGVAVRVRMGVHTGAPQAHEGSYVGMDVHLAARVAATAVGGQVLLTEATRALLPPDLANALADAGQHRLKDIPAPVRLHQLVGPGSPPLPVRSLGSPADLPAAHGPLVGREAEVSQALDLLSPGRVVTVLGPGGVGKSRLALEVLRRRTGPPDGVWFVPLARLRTEEEVWRSLAGAAAVPDGAASRGQVLAGLATRSLLLALDNLEHLDEGVDAVRSVLDEAPGVEVIVTSRTSLRLGREQLLPLAPLQPDEAVQLYVLQAQRQRPGFQPDPDDLAAIREICERVDHLPLAVELVAARSRLLGPRAVLSRLDDALDVTGRTVDRSPRQLTLRSTLDWSWRLLSPAAARAVARLSVFRGPFDVEAAAEVLDETVDGTVDLLLDLADASLVHADERSSGDPRFRVLGVVGRYARERLEEDPAEVEDARDRHTGVVAAVVGRECPRLRGTHHIAALDALEEQRDDIVAALDRSLRPGSTRLAAGLEMCRLLSWYWHNVHQEDGRRWLRRASEVAGETDDPAALAAWHGLGILLDQQGEHDRAADILRRCLDAAVARGDTRAQGRESNSLGLVELHRGDTDRARELFTTASRLAAADGDAERMSTSLTNLALLELEAGEVGSARERLARVLEIDLRLGDVWGIAVDRLNLAQASLVAGDLDAAWEGLIGHGPDMLALGDSELDAELLEQLALLAVRRGRPAVAAALIGTADSVRAAADVPRPPRSEHDLRSGVASARAEVPDQDWRAASEEGRSRTAQQAWEHARSALEDVTSLR
ncbi:ATP-binding protein [Ornithinimicrobium cerasi]|uniref:ATP-binding protein n=1 Tax=Ornithinimicrobium cerasi TaxID=2248773 RepID=UPI000EFE5E0D|nr:tetratricopeptide repeat protein [Ornithinimicrobium cerasi]